MHELGLNKNPAATHLLKNTMANKSHHSFYLKAYMII